MRGGDLWTQHTKRGWLNRNSNPFSLARMSGDVYIAFVYSSPITSVFVRFTNVVTPIETRQSLLLPKVLALDHGAGQVEKTESKR